MTPIILLYLCIGILSGIIGYQYRVICKHRDECERLINALCDLDDCAADHIYGREDSGYFKD